jgi:hypothetical protein
MTNGDKIGQMSNEELAEFIRNGNVCAYMDKPECLYRTCLEGIKAYLDMEVEE